MAKTKKAQTNKTIGTRKTPTAKKASKSKISKTRISKTPTNSGAKKPSGKIPTKAKETVTIDRRTSKDRRKPSERRKNDGPVAVERRQLERREKVNRRRQIDPTTCERDYSVEEIEFMNALDEYKRSSGRMFPTCSEILEVFKKMGYEKRLPEPITQPVAEALLEQIPQPTLSQTAV